MNETIPNYIEYENSNGDLCIVFLDGPLEEKEECAPLKKPTGSLLFLALLFFFLLLLCLGV